MYLAINKLVPKLTRQEAKDAPGDYLVDEKSKQVYLSEEGHQHIEEIFAEAGLLKEGGKPL